MKIAVLLALLVLAPWPAAAQLPGSPVVTFGAPEVTTFPMSVTWTPATGATSYVVKGAFNDNTAFFSFSAVISPLLRAMPYHASGTATPGWLCVTATGAPEGSCVGFTAPARPAATTTTTNQVTYTEPATNLDGTALTNLGAVRIYWKIDSGGESMMTLPVSGPAGGAVRSAWLTVPYTSGTLNVQATAVNTTGAESLRTPVASKVLGAPNKGTITTTTITQ